MCWSCWLAPEHEGPFRSSSGPGTSQTPGTWGQFLLNIHRRGKTKRAWQILSQKGHREEEIRGLMVDGLEGNHREENQVNEPRSIPVKGDTKCQGVPFSLISLRGNEFAHFHGANYRAPHLTGLHLHIHARELQGVLLPSAKWYAFPFPLLLMKKRKKNLWERDAINVSRWD